MSAKKSFNKEKKVNKKIQDISSASKEEELRVTAEEIEASMKPSENDTTSHIDVAQMKREMNQIIGLSKGDDVKQLRKDAIMPTGVKLSEKQLEVFSKTRQKYETKMEEIVIKSGLKVFPVLYPGIFRKLIYPMTKEDKERMAMFLHMVSKVKNGDIDIKQAEENLGQGLYERYIEPTLDETDKKRVKENLLKMKMTPAEKKKKKRQREKLMKENAKKIALKLTQQKSEESDSEKNNKTSASETDKEDNKESTSDNTDPEEDSSVTQVTKDSQKKKVKKPIKNQSDSDEEN